MTEIFIKLIIFIYNDDDIEFKIEKEVCMLPSQIISYLDQIRDKYNKSLTDNEREALILASRQIEEKEREG